MHLEQPKSLGKTIEVTATNRPIKVAYLVPHEESPDNHMVIDAVFYESYTRWAGVYTLIIPSDSRGFLYPNYEAWLQLFDPDFICAYLELEVDLVKKIDRLSCPIALIQHQIRKIHSHELRWQDFICDWGHYFAPISSMTTVQSPRGRYAFLGRREPEAEVTVATQFQDSSTNRFFSDNFGTAFDVHIVTHAIPGLFRTLCLVPPGLSDRIVAGTERCTTVAEMLSAISNGKVVPIASFAMSHSEAIRRPQQRQWASNFNLFIGDSLLDRIHFWNARHFSTGMLVPEMTFFNDPDLVVQLGKYLNNNNFIGQSNGPRRVSLRSHSHTQEELASINRILQQHTHNMVVVSETFNRPAIPDTSDLKLGFYTASSDTSTFKVAEDSSTITPKEPAHFIYIAPRHKFIAKGQWMVDLDIQRHNNLSPFSNVVDNWMLPRRREIVKAFTTSLGKITAGNQLAVLPTLTNYPFGGQLTNTNLLYALRLPSDESFFRYLVQDFVEYPNDDLRGTTTKASQRDLSISDKGQNLRGVISMFDRLYDAYSILTNKYWREVLRSANDDSAKYLVFTRNKLDSFLPNDRSSKETMMGKLNVDDIGKVQKFMDNNLTDTLEYLIRVNVFYCVHQWRCQFCGHINSRNFDGMMIRNTCGICNTVYFAPIDLEWTYQLNEFVYRSLVKHTGLPVLWTLGFLQDQSRRHSFWYLPEVDLYKDHNQPDEKSEIDILCMSEGKFYAVEVKLSASQLVNSSKEVKDFIEKVGFIQPDVAMLSFERYCDREEDVEGIRNALSERVDQIKRSIGSGTEVRVLVASDLREFIEHPAELGHFGRRTGSLY
jgi:hypothetical protein